MAATIFDHPGLLLLIVFVALVRWLASRAKSQTQDQQAPPASTPPSRPIPRGGDSQTEEERIRKFLEALGQPPGTTPPKVATRQREVRPKIFPQLPPLTTTPPPLVAARRTKAATPPPLPVEDGSWKAPTGPEPAYEVRDVTRQTSSEPSPEIRRTSSFDRRIKLGSPADLRTAIILREIFGPPRSLQPPDLSSAV
jgi:hypothetical protein